MTVPRVYALRTDGRSLAVVHVRRVLCADGTIYIAEPHPKRLGELGPRPMCAQVEAYLNQQGHGAWFVLGREGADLVIQGDVLVWCLGGGVPDWVRQWVYSTPPALLEGMLLGGAAQLPPPKMSEEPLHRPVRREAEPGPERSRPAQEATSGPWWLRVMALGFVGVGGLLALAGGGITAWNALNTEPELCALFSADEPLTATWCRFVETDPSADYATERDLVLAADANQVPAARALLAKVFLKRNPDVDGTERIPTLSGRSAWSPKLPRYRCEEHQATDLPNMRRAGKAVDDDELVCQVMAGWEGQHVRIPSQQQVLADGSLVAPSRPGCDLFEEDSAEWLFCEATLPVHASDLDVLVTDILVSGLDDPAKAVAMRALLGKLAMSAYCEDPPWCVNAVGTPPLEAATHPVQTYTCEAMGNKVQGNPEWKALWGAEEPVAGELACALFGESKPMKLPTHQALISLPGEAGDGDTTEGERPRSTDPPTNPPPRRETPPAPVTTPPTAPPAEVEPGPAPGAEGAGETVEDAPSSEGTDDASDGGDTP